MTLEVTSLPNVEFEMLVPISDRGQELITQAIHLLRNIYPDSPKQYKIVIASEFHDPITKLILPDLFELYDPETHNITLAANVIRAKMKLGLPEEETFMVLAVHSAIHAIQFYRGDSPLPSLQNGESRPGYFDDVFEAEAWEGALKVFKMIYPQASGQISHGGRVYKLPA